MFPCSSPKWFSAPRCHSQDFARVPSTILSATPRAKIPKLKRDSRTLVGAFTGLRAPYFSLSIMGCGPPLLSTPCGGFKFIVPPVGPCVFYVIVPLAIDTSVMLIPFCNTAKASIAFLTCLWASVPHVDTHWRHPTKFSSQRHSSRRRSHSRSLSPRPKKATGILYQRARCAGSCQQRRCSCGRHCVDVAPPIRRGLAQSVCRCTVQGSLHGFH